QEEKKYTLTNTTKVEKLSGKKDNQTRSESSRDELKEGQSITLVLSGEKVEKIEFTQGKKSK
ncbi:MAG TPA: hypothetical protein PKD72_00995, partial [Gemmatales bacterium]|nr:hypothetical protein [Gemmatales bacterium]